MFYYFLSMSVFMLSVIVLLGYGLFRLVYSKRKWNLVETLVISFVFGIFILTLDYVVLLALFGTLTQWNVLASLTFMLGFIYVWVLFQSRKRLVTEGKTRKSDRHPNLNIYFVALCCIYFVALSWRLFYVSSCYPFFTGWDTSLYVSNVILHTKEFPNYVPSGLPFSHSILYPLGAIFFSTFQNYHAVPVFISVIDSFSVFGIYLLFKYVSKDSKIAILGVLMYSLSFFAFRFFSDLFKDIIANSLLPIGLYLVLKGYDKKDIHGAVLAGLIFGFSMLAHTDSLYRIALYLLVFAIVALAFSLRAKSRWLLRCLFITSLTALIVLSFYQTYLYIAGTDYSLWDRFFAVFLGPLQPVIGEAHARDIAYAIPSSGLFLNDWAPLLFGGIFLIIRNKRDGIWWNAISCTLLSLSQLPHMGIYLPTSLRIFYYYGFFSYLLKATFLLSITSILIKMLTKSKKTTLAVTIKSRKAVISFAAILIVAVLLFDGFVAQTDIFSFYPVKREISHLDVFHQSSIGQVILKPNQYEGLLWLRDQITDHDRVVTSGRLQVYTSFILFPEENKEIMYDLPRLESQEDWLAAHNLVSGDLVKGVRYFSDMNVNCVYIALDRTYEYTRKLADKLSFSTVFEKVFQNDDISIFRVDVKKVATDFEYLISNAYVSVTSESQTFTKPLTYHTFEDFPYFSLSLTGVTECNVTKIPSYLVFKSIFPAPKKLAVDANSSIYFEGTMEENYTLTFMATYPYLDVGWKDDSFLEWTQTEGVTFESDGNVASVYTYEKLYGGIHRRIDINVSEHRYLIIRHKVDQGWMEIKLIKPDWSSVSVLASGTQEWTIKVIDLHNLDVYGTLMGINIQGNQLPTRFELDFILFASTSS